MAAEGADEQERVLGMLLLTRRCNLACRYCHMQRGAAQDAHPGTLKTAIDLFFRSFPRLELQFFGGEPLLRLDLITFCVDYVREAWSERGPTSFMVTTNALLLEGRTLDALLEREVKLMLSLDGTFGSQRASRFAARDGERAYRIIVDNMGELRRRGVPFFVNAVVSPDNVDRLEDNVAALFEAGAPTVQLGYELGVLWDPEQRRRYLEALVRVKERYQGDPARRIQNGWEAEPVLASSFFVVDVGGEVHHGCAIVLEDSLPTFNQATRLGSLSGIGSSLAPLRRPLLAQLGHLRRATRPSPDEYARLRSNLLLGLAARRRLRYAR